MIVVSLFIGVGKVLLNGLPRANVWMSRRNVATFKPIVVQRLLAGVLVAVVLHGHAQDMRWVLQVHTGL